MLWGDCLWDVEKGGCGGGSYQALLCFRVCTGFNILFKTDYLDSKLFFPRTWPTGNKRPESLGRGISQVSVLGPRTARGFSLCLCPQVAGMLLSRPCHP